MKTHKKDVVLHPKTTMYKTSFLTERSTYLGYTIYNSDYQAIERIKNKKTY